MQKCYSDYSWQHSQIIIFLVIDFIHFWSDLEHVGDLQPNTIPILRAITSAPPGIRDFKKKENFDLKKIAEMFLWRAFI